MGNILCLNINSKIQFHHIDLKQNAANSNRIDIYTWLYFELFWRENELTLLYKLHTDYFSLCQSVILSVLSHEEIYLDICRNV